jgi:hypothetical protein
MRLIRWGKGVAAIAHTAQTWWYLVSCDRKWAVVPVRKAKFFKWLNGEWFEEIKLP